MTGFKPYISESYLYHAAVHYLQRYASTVTQLRRVLQRKVQRAQMKGEEISPDAPQWIEKAVEKCVKLGFVNDQIFAEQKSRSLRRQGKARHFIINTLQQKGVDKALIREVMEQEEGSELDAAIRTVQRKRLGRDPSPEGRQKDLAKLVRGGFALQIARQALKTVADDTDKEHEDHMF